MNSKRKREIEKAVGLMFQQVTDPIELKRIMRQAKKLYNRHLDEKEAKNARNERRTVST